MPFLNSDVPPFKPTAPKEIMWDNFRGGLDTLLKSSEIKDNELCQSDNLELDGKGVPTKRNGTNDYFLAGVSASTGEQQVRGLKYVKFASGASGVPELLAVSDYGYLVKKSNASYSIIPGYSYVSGFPVEMTQIQNSVYISNSVNPLTKYSGVSIFPFIGLSRPTSLTATNLSGVSGVFTYSWRVSAESAVGETLASEPVMLSNMPQDLTETRVKLSWGTASPASVVGGYVVYGREGGNEAFITRLPATELTWIDDCSQPESYTVEAPTEDSTTGPIFKYQTVHKDKLIGANLSGSPSTLIWSGGGTNIDKFLWAHGGGSVDISKDDGDEITGVHDSFDSVIVFKERSVWQITFSATAGIVVPTVKLLMRGVGCVAHRTICSVENDVYFLGRNGVFVLGYEPNIMNVLRTNVLSARVSSFFDGISAANAHECCAVYYDSKYRITRPDGKEIIYDRERLAWMGPNTYPASPNIYAIHYDDNNNEKLLWGDREDNFVTEYSDSYSNDKGSIIPTRMLTKKEDFGDPYVFKDLIEIYSNWRSVQGTVNVDIITETRTGTTVTAKNFQIAVSNAGTGWGFDKWGTAKWGNTAGAGSGLNSNDIVKRARLNKLVRNVQLDVSTNGSNDNYELLSIKHVVRKAGSVTPSSWDVS
jgi:hypothetical protein